MGFRFSANPHRKNKAVMSIMAEEPFFIGIIQSFNEILTECTDSLQIKKGSCSPTGYLLSPSQTIPADLLFSSVPIPWLPF